MQGERVPWPAQRQINPHEPAKNLYEKGNITGEEFSSIQGA